MPELVTSKRVVITVAVPSQLKLSVAYTHGAIREGLDLVSAGSNKPARRQDGDNHE
jgi:hypothetical protein